MKIAKISVILLISVIFLSATGFSTKKSVTKDKLPGYAFVPMGSTTINNQQVSVSAFWISETEISNKQYNEFLESLKAAGRIEDYEIARIRNENWNTPLGYNEPYAEFYHTHPAYNNYPVVNVTYEGAILFCKWLTEEIDEGGPEFRLPSKYELIYAAKGGLDFNPFPWGGTSLKNKKGLFRCNFLSYGDELIHTTETGKHEVVTDPLIFGNSDISKAKKKLNNTVSITATVDSYWPNNYGLYNTSGNVAEMVDEPGIALGGSWKSTGFDVQVNSESTYEGPSVFVGFRPVRDFQP